MTAATGKKVEPMTPEFYQNNRIVTATRVAEIDKELSEILSRLGKHSHPRLLLRFATVSRIERHDFRL